MVITPELQVMIPKELEQEEATPGQSAAAPSKNLKAVGFNNTAMQMPEEVAGSVTPSGSSLATVLPQMAASQELLAAGETTQPSSSRERASQISSDASDMLRLRQEFEELAQSNIA